MTRVLENKTVDELRVGDQASLRRALSAGDLRLWSALTGNPSLDDGFVEGRGVVSWATSLFSTLILS